MEKNNEVDQINMKIAWFTPFNTKSAIGRYSQIITEEIGRSAEIDIWVSGASPDLYTTKLNICRYTPQDPDIHSRLKEYDYVIYNIGDFSGYHSDIYAVFLKFPGIVILHDHGLFNFFLGHYYSLPHGKDIIVGTTSLCYGKAVGNLAQRSLDGSFVPSIWNRDDSIKYPLFEPLLINALGVITHSEYVKSEISRLYPGPIVVVNNPYYGHSNYKGINKVHTRMSEKVKLLTLGNVNPNKHIHKVIEAIGNNAILRKMVHYDVVGKYDLEGGYFRRLQDLVTRYKLEEIIRFHSYVSNEELAQYLEQSDICINLRFPVLNGGSWSLIDELDASKPVVVTNAGFYADLPDGVVMKVSVGNNEVTELEMVLTKLARNTTLRDTYGRNGKEYAHQTYTVDRYVHNFNTHIRKVDECKTKMKLLLRTAEEIGSFTHGIDEGTLTGIVQRIVKISELSK